MLHRKATFAAAAMAGLVSGASLIGCQHHDQPNSAGVQATSSDSTMAVGKHDCKGMNACKGQGGCKTDANACKGQNACKGKGGCNTNKPQ